MLKQAVLYLSLLVMIFVVGCAKQQVQTQQQTPTGQANSIVGKSLNAGKSSQCKQQLLQIRSAIQAYKVDSGTEQNPAGLADLNLNVPAEYYRCPITGQDYIYDPNTGEVKCPNPQHSDY